MNGPTPDAVLGTDQRELGALHELMGLSEADTDVSRPPVPPRAQRQRWADSAACTAFGVVCVACQTGEPIDPCAGFLVKVWCSAALLESKPSWPGAASARRSRCCETPRWICWLRPPRTGAPPCCTPPLAPQPRRRSCRTLRCSRCRSSAARKVGCWQGAGLAGLMAAGCLPFVRPGNAGHCRCAWLPCSALPRRSRRRRPGPVCRGLCRAGAGRRIPGLCGQRGGGRGAAAGGHGGGGHRMARSAAAAGPASPRLCPLFFRAAARPSHVGGRGGRMFRLLGACWWQGGVFQGWSSWAGPG